jgi:hypothetical protein
VYIGPYLATQAHSPLALWRTHLLCHPLATPDPSFHMKDFKVMLNETSRKAGLGNLPSEILEQMFEAVDMQTLRTVRLVNKRLSGIACHGLFRTISFSTHHYDMAMLEHFCGNETLRAAVRELRWRDWLYPKQFANDQDWALDMFLNNRENASYTTRNSSDPADTPLFLGYLGNLPFVCVLLACIS